MRTRLSVLLTLTVLVLGFQNCAPVGFDGSQSSASLSKLDIEDGEIIIPKEDEDFDDENEVPTDLPEEPPVANEPPPVKEDKQCDKEDQKQIDAAALCDTASSKLASLKPGAYVDVNVRGLGAVRFLYASSAQKLDIRGNGSVVIVGADSNTGVKEAIIRGTGDLVVCDMNIETVDIRGIGSVHVVGGNVTSNVDIRGAGSLKIFSADGALVSEQSK